MFAPCPSRIFYCYGEYQQAFKKLESRGVVFNYGVPKADSSALDGREPTLLIIDDLMDRLDEKIASLFTKGSHHRNLTVVFLAQNMFHKSPHMRTASLNSHYIVLFKSPRDASQISVLARQMYPSNSKFAVEAYKNATAEPYSYLLIDLRPEQIEQLRLRSNIFTGERQFVYVPLNDTRKK
jgi:hypothetical protein